MELLVLLAVIVIVGALLGGNSFGETVRKGCGCLTLLILLLIALAIFIKLQEPEEDVKPVSSYPISYTTAL